MTASHDSMNLKVVTDQNLSYVLSNEEERATLLMDSLIILPASAGNKAGAWAVCKVNPKSVVISSLLGPDNKPTKDVVAGEHRFVLNDDKLMVEGAKVLPAAFGGNQNQGYAAGDDGTRFMLSGPTDVAELEGKVPKCIDHVVLKEYDPQKREWSVVDQGFSVHNIVIDSLHGQATHRRKQCTSPEAKQFV